MTNIDLHDLFERFLRSEGLEWKPWKPDDADESLGRRGETPCSKGHDLLDEMEDLIQRKGGK